MIVADALQTAIYNKLNVTSVTSLLTNEFYLWFLATGVWVDDAAWSDPENWTLSGEFVPPDAFSGAAIFTDVPQSPDAELPAFFPYIVIGGDIFTPFNDKDATGATAIVQVDVYARTASMLPVKQIAGAVQAVLDRQELTIAGTGWIDTQLDGVDFTRDPDGLTKRAILQFRVTYMG